MENLVIVFCLFSATIALSIGQIALAIKSDENINSKGHGYVMFFATLFFLVSLVGVIFSKQVLDVLHERPSHVLVPYPVQIPIKSLPAEAVEVPKL